MLTAGTRLGPYEILAPLGAGGMGQVYRATDTNLGRQVAIKVLPDAFAEDAERLARFDREARTLAALNHPNIAAIYGLERSAGITALVMELVEGPTLADRIASGPVPVDEALAIARQIAEALEAAHEQTIIHRDLKPSNVKVRDDGTVKVLDFGLAKALEPVGAESTVQTMSPTITTPAMTRAGMILGTAAYMSPEQAKGRAADKRSDIWAFGCVLYEMLSGKRAFDGEDMTDVLGAVVRLDPDWSALPSDVPALVRAGLERCLVKDRRRRAGDTSTILFVLDKASSLIAAGSAPATQENAVSKEVAAARADEAAANARREMARLSRRRVAAASVGAVLTVVIAIAGTWFAMRPDPPAVVRTSIETSGGATFTPQGVLKDLAITPDGSRVVYRGRDGLVVRPLERLEPTVLTGLGPSSDVFMSPDGQWVGFHAGGFFRKVAITGGPPIAVLQVEGAPRGATWTPDDTIVYATSSGNTGLQRVPSGGGTAEVLTKPDRQRGELDHWFPEVLPGGDHVLFTIIPGGLQVDRATIAVLDLGTGSVKVVLRGGIHAQYVRGGYLVYNGGGTLRAVGFDLDRLEVFGTPVAVSEQVGMNAAEGAQAAVALNGTFVYTPAGGSGGQFRTPRSLVWVDREGRETAIPLPPRTYTYPRISPDGVRVALDIRDEQNDLWIWEVGRPTVTRLTTDAGTDYYPVWTPDGRGILYYSAGKGGTVFRQSADGTGSPEPLTNDVTTPHYPYSVSPDGRSLVFQETLPKTGVNLSLLSMPGSTGPSRSAEDSVTASKRDVKPLIHSEFIETNAEISPDGRWIAYQSNKSGREEIYVQPFPNVDSGLWQVSTAGGTRPVWARNGREIFYLDANSLLTAVAVETTPTFSRGNPVTVLKTAYFSGFGGGGQTVAGRTYDVSPDGRRFLMIKDVARDQPQATIVVVQNWVEELKRLVPRP